MPGRKFQRTLKLASGTLLFWASTAACADEAEQAVGSGEDLIKIIRHVDFRTEFNGTSDTSETRFTLRYDERREIGNGWRLKLRVDAPYVIAHETDDQGERQNTSGVGDMLFEIVFTKLTAPQHGFGLGMQVLAPRAGEKALGSGKWRLRPGIGYRWPVAGVSDSSFFQMILRYDFSIAGDDDRSDVRQLQFAPNLELGLPKQWYVSFFPSTDIRYDFVRHQFFLPANIEVGKEWGRWVASVEGGKALIKGDRPPYDWKIEGRLGLRF